MTLGLWADGHLKDEATAMWQPQKHWEVYLVHYAHHDLGYTDVPSSVLEEYHGFMDKVLQFLMYNNKPIIAIMKITGLTRKNMYHHPYDALYMRICKKLGLVSVSQRLGALVSPKVPPRTLVEKGDLPRTV